MPPVGTRISRYAKGERKRDNVARAYIRQGWKLITIYEEELPHTTLYSLILEYTGG